jgi:RNA polymerase sigma-70 factor (ECF subfamily)
VPLFAFRQLAKNFSDHLHPNFIFRKNKKYSPLANQNFYTVSIVVTEGKGENGLSLSEAQLIQGAKTGDREAFCRLAQSYERRLYHLALHYCRDAHDAEDLTQEVWLKAYRSLNSFRGDSSFYTWLRRIAINTFLNHQRDANVSVSANAPVMKGESVPLDEVYELPDERTRNAEEVMQQKQLVGQVTRALAELTPQQRLIFLLKHREEMSVEEISRECNVSTGTVKKSLFRAVHKIREHLGIVSDARKNAGLAVGETI